MTFHASENSRKPTPIQTIQRTARQNGVGRRPNCHAMTERPPSCAKNTATSTKPASCTAVSAICRPSGRC